MHNLISMYAPYPNENFPMEFNMLLSERVSVCVNECMLLNEPKRWDKSYLLGSSIAYVRIKSVALLALLFFSYDEKYDEREKYWRVFSRNTPCSHSIIAPQHMQGIQNHRAAKIHSLYTCRLISTCDRSSSSPHFSSLSFHSTRPMNFRLYFHPLFFPSFLLLFYLSILREFIFPPRIFNGCHAV